MSSVEVLFSWYSDQVFYPLHLHILSWSYPKQIESGQVSSNFISYNYPSLLAHYSSHPLVRPSHRKPQKKPVPLSESPDIVDLIVLQVVRAQFGLKLWCFVGLPLWEFLNCVVCQCSPRWRKKKTVKLKRNRMIDWSRSFKDTWKEDMPGRGRFM